MAADRAEIILIYPSSNLLLNAEDVLSELNLPYRLIPTPKEVHSSCGLSMCYDFEKHEEYLRILIETRNGPGTVFKLSGGVFTRLA